MTLIRNELTGSIAKRKCPKCKSLITFYELHPCICDICGTKVYPTKDIEFKEKLLKEMKKHELFLWNRKINK